MSFVSAQLENPSIEPGLRQDALDRIYSDPGVPDAKQTTSSFWLKDPHPTIARCRSTKLPKKAEIVIIGSGITGASVAKTLLEDSPIDSHSSRPKIIMLEARDICSGATGRNGGHILETGEDYIVWKERFGKEAAMKMVRFRLAHLENLIKIANDLGLSDLSQSRKVQFLSAYFDEDLWIEAKEGFQEFMADMPVESSGWGTIEGDALAKDLLLPRAKGVIHGTAGAMWPYKFVTGLLAHLQEQFPSDFCIESNTPATDIVESNGNFLVTTPRGAVQCKHVVHCTNAHVGHLLPGVRGRIFPIRGLMSAQRSGEKFPNQGSKHSWLLNYHYGYDYLTQLPDDGATSRGEMMLGGGFAQTQGGGITEIGIATDDDINFYADMHLGGVLSAIFGRENWGSVQGESVKALWSGNMGFSSDGLPWVGQVPASASKRKISSESNSILSSGAEWMAAAFSGEGMVNAWLCGKAVAMMLLQHEGKLIDQKSNWSDWFPEEMLLTEQRLEEAVLPRHVEGAVVEQPPHHNLKRATTDNIAAHL